MLTVDGDFAHGAGIGGAEGMSSIAISFRILLTLTPNGSRPAG